MSEHPMQQQQSPRPVEPTISATDNRQSTTTNQRGNVAHPPTSSRHKPRQLQSPRRAHLGPQLEMQMNPSPVHQGKEHTHTHTQQSAHRTTTANIQRPRPAHVVVHCPTSPRHDQSHHAEVPSHSHRHSTEVSTTDQGPLPPPKSPRTPNSPASANHNQSLSKRLLSALAHKPTLSKTWEKRSYAEEARSLPLSPTSTEQLGPEGNERRASRARPTSFYASPADIAAYRPLPMVEGGPIYPYSAPVTPVPAHTPPSHA